MCTPTAVSSRPLSLASGKLQRYDVLHRHASVPSKLSTVNIPTIFPALSLFTSLQKKTLHCNSNNSHTHTRKHEQPH